MQNLSLMSREYCHVEGGRRRLEGEGNGRLREEDYHLYFGYKGNSDDGKMYLKKIC